jgi:hypothetical protein
VDEIGLYRLSDGARSTVAAVGSVRPLELADVRTTAERLRPAADATGGAVIWLGEGSVPELRRVRRGRDAFGTLGAGERAWLPAAAVLLLALAALALAWRREGM